MGRCRSEDLRLREVEAGCSAGQIAAANAPPFSTHLSRLHVSTMSTRKPGSPTSLPASPTSPSAASTSCCRGIGSPAPQLSPPDELRRGPHRMATRNAHALTLPSGGGCGLVSGNRTCAAIGGGLVFIDETSSNTKMTRLRGRARRG